MPENLDLKIFDVLRESGILKFQKSRFLLKSSNSTPHMEKVLKPRDLTLYRSHDPVPIHTIFPYTLEVSIDVSQTQVIMGRNSLVSDVYPMTSGNHFVHTLENKIISDSAQIEIPKQVMDVLRTHSISNWTS